MASWRLFTCVRHCCVLCVVSLAPLSLFSGERARSVVCVVSVALWRLFTGVRARCVVFGCLPPLGACSQVWAWCDACAVSLASLRLFSGVRVLCVVLSGAACCFFGVGCGSSVRPRAHARVAGPARFWCCVWPPGASWVLGTWSCILVLAGCASLTYLIAPHLCAVLLRVRSLLERWLAFPSPFCLPLPGAYAPEFTGRLRGARGGRTRTGLMVPVAGPRRGGALGSLRVVPVRGPAVGLSLKSPSGVHLGLRALRLLFASVHPVTDASGFVYCSSLARVLGRCTGLFCVDADTSLCGSEDAIARSMRVCVCVRSGPSGFPGRVRRAGLLGAF